ncbi:hypothetical protein LTR36_000268 [Oleoguttula mirabilis]|uniref:Uncharacterized protein n=1 Tax=Oleoguttula mirabilis TaxID=1507867 RepID=A0AAV9JYF1_9PEZI|nr:hypothetical protein LTR36_000268 [Oleoguttula mirabilis]
MADLQQQSMEPSPLLSLPSELRNAIYEYVLDEEGKTIKTVILPTPMVLNGTEVTMVSSDNMALLCRQTCVEYSDIYNKAALDLEDSHQYVISVEDLSFDNAMSAFFSKLTPPAQDMRYVQKYMIINLYFTKRFSGMMEP